MQFCPEITAVRLHVHGTACPVPDCHPSASSDPFPLRQRRRRLQMLWGKPASCRAADYLAGCSLLTLLAQDWETDWADTCGAFLVKNLALTGPLLHSQSKPRPLLTSICSLLARSMGQSVPRVCRHSCSGTKDANDHQRVDQDARWAGTTPWHPRHWTSAVLPATYSAAGSR